MLMFQNVVQELQRKVLADLIILDSYTKFEIKDIVQ